MNKIIKMLLLTAFLLNIISFNLYAFKKDSPFYEAIKLSKEKKYKKAIKKIKAVIKKNPELSNKKAQIFLGLMYYKSKQYDFALEKLNESLIIDETNPMAFYFMGLIYEAKALKEKDESKILEMKKKALNAWENFILHSDKLYEKNSQKMDKKSEKHARVCISPEESIERANKHIENLKEYIYEK